MVTWHLRAYKFPFLSKTINEFQHKFFLLLGPASLFGFHEDSSVPTITHVLSSSLEVLGNFFPL